MSSNSNTIPDGHKDFSLQEKIKEITAKITMMGSMLFALITLPAMPLIFYLTILYNVMMLVMEFFSDL